MLACRSAIDRPYLLEPRLMFLFGQSGCGPLFLGRLPIAPRLSEHQDEFDIILENGVGLVRFAEKAGPVFDLVVGVRNLVPKDRTQIVEADLARSYDYIGMQGHDHVTSVLAAREANVAHHTDYPPAWNQRTEAM